MKLRIALTGVLYFLYCAGPANAAITLSCASPESIEEEASDCWDNGSFGQAAMDCLHALDKAVAERTAQAKVELAASNAAHVDNAGNAQNHNFAGSGSDYQITQQALAEQIAASKYARKVVDSYLDHIYFPEDWDADEDFIGGDRNEYIESMACFADNQHGIEGIVKKIDGYIADFEKTKASSNVKGDTSGTREGNTGSLNGDQIKGQSRGEGSVKGIPTGQSQNGASDITGVKQDQDKQKQAPGN